MLLKILKNRARTSSYTFGMATAKESIRDVLAANTKVLMKRRGWTQQQLASKAKMSQTHVGNVLRKEVDPTTAVLGALGSAFDIPPWLLLVPNLPPDILDSKEVPNLLQTYLEASTVPLSTVIAERAARK